MKKLLNFIAIFFACMLLTACGSESDGGGSTPTPTPPGTLGQLSNGSYVTSSANNIAAGNGQSAHATISINGGTTGNFLFLFDATNNASSIATVASVQSVPGIIITPNTCNLGTSGSGFSSSCEITVTVAPTVPSNTYYIYPSVSGQKALSPITILVSNSQTDSSKNITSFMINGVNGIVQNNTISVTLPYATNLNALVATYVTTGKSVTVNGQVQTNGVTSNNFANSVTQPVIYTVTAEDGTTQNYNVSVNTTQNTAKQITSFNIGSNQGVIIGNNISVQVAHGVPLTSLVATFATTGAKVSVNGVEQQNGLTQNDFTQPVTYTVAAADGSTQNYTVTVTSAIATDKAITNFEVNGSSNPVLIDQDNHIIHATLPYEANLTTVMVNFDISGVKMTTGGNEVFSGYTQDFTNPVVYIVYAADGSSQEYTVTITTAPSDAKDMTTFALNGIQGRISNNNIAVDLPFGTDLSTLIADFDITGRAVTVDNIEQISGSIVSFANDKQTLVYTVYAANGTTQDYTVTVTVAKSNYNDLTMFNISNDIGTITGNQIGIQIANGASLTNLVATFNTTGTKVEVDGVIQQSGVTSNDFTHPVTYTVTAENGETQTYTVTVTNAPATAKDITSFEVNGNNITAYIDQNNHIINATLPYGADLTTATVNFDISGTKMTVDNNTVISGYTQDFTNPVVYTVTAEDSSTQEYIVTITTAPNNAKEITNFALNGFDGVIINNNIIVQLPFTTDLKTLHATFTITGKAVTIGAVEQISGNIIDFNNEAQSLIYTVYAADGSTRDYLVTAQTAPDFHNDMLSFSINDNHGNINGNTIEVLLPYGVPLTNLVATFNTNGAKVLVKDIKQQSDVTANNFESVVDYVVYAANDDTQTYGVTVRNVPSDAKKITAFALNGNNFTDDIDQNNHIIFATLPYGTDITRVQVDFDISGNSMSVNGKAVVTGYIQDFTSPIVYTVKAADNTTQTYTVNVNIAANDAKAFTAFALDGFEGTINEENHTISILLPLSIDLKTAIADFTTTGHTVLIHTTEQISGITPNNFNNDTKSLTYTVYAANGQTQDYVVTVTQLFPEFIAIGSSGTIEQGYNNATLWVDAKKSPTNLALKGIAVNHSGLFVAVGEKGTVITSTNGINWTSHTSGLSNDITAITVNKSGLFVATSSNGSIITSSNGTNWTTHSSGVDSLSSIAANESGLFVAVGSRNISISSNGVNWTKVNSGFDITDYFSSVTVNESGLFVIAGNNYNSDQGLITTSTNGTNWSSGTYHRLSNGSFKAIASHGSDFVVVGEIDKTFVSNNGASSWSDGNTGTNTNALNGITANNSGLFIAVGSNGTIVTSSNPKSNSWTTEVNPSKVTLNAVIAK